MALNAYHESKCLELSISVSFIPATLYEEQSLTFHCCTGYQRCLRPTSQGASDSRPSRRAHPFRHVAVCNPRSPFLPAPQICQNFAKHAFHLTLKAHPGSKSFCRGFLASNDMAMQLRIHSRKASALNTIDHHSICRTFFVLPKWQRDSRSQIQGVCAPSTLERDPSAEARSRVHFPRAKYILHMVLNACLGRGLFTVSKWHKISDSNSGSKCSGHTDILLSKIRSQVVKMAICSSDPNVSWSTLICRSFFAVPKWQSKLQSSRSQPGEQVL